MNQHVDVQKEINPAAAAQFSDLFANLSREAERDSESHICVVTMGQTSVDILGLVSLRVLYHVLIGKKWSDFLDVVSTCMWRKLLHSASMTKPK